MTDGNFARLDRIRGGLYGLLVGDALGVPYEFHDATEIPAEHELEMEPPNGFRRAHAGVPAGTWGDDGAQALCLLDSVSCNASLDLVDFAGQLLAWYENGHMMPEGQVFDVGIQTQRALGNLKRNCVAANQAGPSGERDNGNGALMRCLPVVLVAKTTDDVIELAMRQGVVTHGHSGSQLCCPLYALTGAAILDGLAADAAASYAQDELRRRFAETGNEREVQIVLSA
jgi:ADP-ribosylglycohydrolase